MTLVKAQVKEMKAPNFEMMPEALKQHPKWMLWKAELQPTKEEPEKMGKVPYQVNGKYRASFNDPKHWLSFEQAKAAYERGGFDGVGVVINRNDRLVCVDLDDFEDMNSIPADKFNLTIHSYTELSPSEKGLHIWIKGQKPLDCGTNKNGVEMYGNETNTFMTVTGFIYDERMTAINEHQKLIDMIANKFLKDDAAIESNPVEPAAIESDLTDEDILHAALQDPMTKKLFNGDFSDYKDDTGRPDQSKGDYALCYDLAKFTKDAGQIERIFKKSGLYRQPPKKHATYPQRTVKRAVAEVNKVTSISKKDAKPQEKKAIVIEHPNKYYTYNMQGQLKFNTHLVKKEILADAPVFRSDIGILRYENGIYKRSSKDDIKHLIQKKIKEEATISRKNEITDLILHEYAAIPLSDFNSKHKILNLKNGIYSITDGTFHSHSRKCLWTIQSPVEYNPEAKCPAILDFLHSVLDKDSVQFLIEWIGYMMLPYTDTDKMVFLYGSGGNGKGALINVIQNLLGADNITNMSLKDIEEDKFSRANLYGKLANICGDIDSRIISDTGIIKSLTGGDYIYAQHKGIDGFNFRSFAKLMFSANELPMSKDKTEGWFRRMFILPFNKKVPAEKRISRIELDKKLTTPEELSGLLNLAIKAIHKLEGNGYQFTVSEAAEQAIQAYKHAHDKIEQFMIEEGSRDGSEELKQFYAAYQDWCRENGNVPEQKRKIKEQLLEKGFIVDRGTGNKIYVFGFSFSEHSPYCSSRKTTTRK